MYRAYENPYSLEKQLADLRNAYENSCDENERLSLKESIEELEDRVRFAWADDEAG